MGEENHAADDRRDAEGRHAVRLGFTATGAAAEPDLCGDGSLGDA